MLYFNVYDNNFIVCSDGDVRLVGGPNEFEGRLD